MFEGEEMYAERTLHKEIPPANIRIKNFDRKELKNYNVRVEEIKRDQDKKAEKKELILQSGIPHRTGITLACIGNQFDVPTTTFADDQTMAGTSYAPSFN